MGELVTLYPKPDAPVQRLVPRGHFGLKENGLSALSGAGRKLASIGQRAVDETVDRIRAEDRAEQARFKDEARAERCAAAVREKMRREPEAPSLEEVIALTDLLDEVAKRAQALSLKSGRAAFQIVAQDAESLSERLCHLAAEER